LPALLAAIDWSGRLAYPRTMQTGPILPPPGAHNGWHDAFVRRLLAAFTRATGRDLAAETGADPAMLGRSVYFGNFALLSHRGDGDATLNYGNAMALKLWECEWREFTAMPSHDTAPPVERSGRDALMAEVSAKGFIDGYSGERVSRSGRRFLIADAVVWRLRDEADTPFGVAAFVPRVTYL
jgi:hypothetical protein